MEPKRVEGIVRQQLSRQRFIVELLDGNEVEMRLKPKQMMNYIRITLGQKVHLMLMPENEKEGLLLTATDFKINGWEGGPSNAVKLRIT